MSAKNVVLTGFMGTGKSTIGTQLAERLGRTFVDTDQVIISRYGPIEKIFESEGESAFRALENEVAVELGKQRNLVIATGGGFLLNQANIDALAANSRIFCLTAPADEIIRRIEADVDAALRPLLSSDDPVAVAKALLAERQSTYAQFEQIDTFMKFQSHVVDDIVSRYSIEDAGQ